MIVYQVGGLAVNFSQKIKIYILLIRIGNVLVAMELNKFNFTKISLGFDYINISWVKSKKHVM